MRKYTILIAFLFWSLTLLPSCFAIDPVESDSKPISHEIWNGLLNKWVDGDGMVNYQGLISDSTQLNQYLSLVKRHHPNEKNWSQNEQLAYWLNAYNAFTVQLIIRNYPVNSIKDIAGSLPFINTSWDIKFIKIENETYDLNNLEHGIIRKQFDEPRIHFALVCAAISCPPLLNEAYMPTKLNKQLDTQAQRFINNPRKNTINKNEATLSKLFSWYKGDFTKSGDLVNYINQFSNIKISDETNINYMDYHWELNEQKR